MNHIFATFRWLLLLLIFGSATAYAAARIHYNQPPAWHTLTCDYFNTLQINGPFDVELISGADAPRVEIFANDAELKQLQVDVGNNSVAVNMRGYSWRQPSANRWLMRVYTDTFTLTRLGLYGTANLVARNFGCPNLWLEAGDGSQVYLRGMIGAFHLSIPNGKPYVDIGQINSENLLIEANGDANIHLAGVTNFMNARICDNTTLDAKSLDVSTIWIQTDDNALAEVIAPHALRAFANGNSNVLYYSPSPKYQTEVTRLSGNVLHIVGY